MRLPAFVVTISALLVSTAAFAQSAVLLLDANKNNRCMKAGKGGMWTLRDTRVNALAVPLSVVKVTLVRNDDSGAPPREVVRFLTVGETADLGCAQGKRSVSYQIVGQQ